ncbi:MAG: type I restriction endonuclease subunit R [Phormidesmis sp.]
MSQISAISESITTFRQVEQKLGLSLSDEPDFFLEWNATLPDLTAAERSRLDAVRKNYLYQISDGALLEETIKLVILSPLLELAGFYSTPYRFRAEVPVEMEALGDNDEILRGRIDGLVLLEQLWIVVIESKKTTFDLEMALPQTLAYMAASPKLELPLYGMVANGSSYLFVKTLGDRYGVSDLFGTRSQSRNNLYEVLKILKHLGSLLTK